MPIQVNADKEGEPCGVGGWLLFYCIVWTIAAPIYAVYDLFHLIGLLKYLPEGSVKIWALLVIALEWAFLPIGVYSGIKLWRIDSNAVSFNRKCWYGALVLCVVISLLGLVMVPRYDGARVFVFWIKTGAAAWIWLAYLKKSRRVQNTYGGGGGHR